MISISIPNKYLGYAKNISTYFGASLIPMALSLLTNPWVAKNMSPTDYAISGYYTSFSSLIGPIIVFYMIHYYLKEYFRLDEKGRVHLFSVIAKALIWFSGIVSVLCFLAMLIYIKYIRGNSDIPISPYLALSVFALPLTGLYNLQLAKFRMEKKATSYFIYSTSNGILGVALTLLFVVILKMGATGKLLAPFLCNVFVFSFILLVYRDVLRISTRLSEFKTVFLFCIPLTFSAMLGYFNNGFTTTYLESVGDTTEYGIYVVGQSIGMYLLVFGTAVGSTFQPDLYETTIKRQWGKYIKFCILEIGLVAIIALVFIIFAPYIVAILTANRYVDSVPYAQICCLTTVTCRIYYIVNDFSIATNRPKLYLYNTVIGSIFVILMVPFFVERWNYIGGAWMNVISYLLFTVIYLLLFWMARHKFIPVK